MDPLRLNNLNQGIKQLSEADRPREKLMLRGQSSLTDAELLAIIIGSGNREESAVQLMQRILTDCDYDLNLLGRMSVEELRRYKGIGEAKAISIVAMLEVGRRRKNLGIRRKSKITSSKDAFEMIANDLIDLNHEEFWILLLNRSGILIKKEQISSGGIAATVVDPKIIFKKAIDHRASSIILVHNHPSGNLNPSFQDKKLTKQLLKAGEVLEILVHDHIVVAGSEYFSFADEGEL